MSQHLNDFLFSLTLSHTHTLSYRYDMQSVYNHMLHLVQPRQRDEQGMNAGGDGNGWDREEGAAAGGDSNGNSNGNGDRDDSDSNERGEQALHPGLGLVVSCMDNEVWRYDALWSVAT